MTLNQRTERQSAWSRALTVSLAIVPVISEITFVSALARSSAVIWAGVIVGLSASRIATAPLTCAHAWEEPSKVSVAVSEEIPRDSILVPGARISMHVPQLLPM